MIEEWHQLATLLHGALQQHMGIDAQQIAAGIGITVASTAHAVADVAEDGAGIAADLAGCLVHHKLSSARIAARTLSGVAGVRVMRAPLAL